MRRISFLFILLTLAGCAGPMTSSPQGSSPEIAQETARQNELVYKRIVQDQDRIFNLAHALETANAEFCGAQVRDMHGFSLWSLMTVPPRYRDAAASLYNLQSRVAVQSVADFSPADKAGIKSGDFIVSVNGQEIPAGPQGVAMVRRALDAAGKGRSDIVLERAGKIINTRVMPLPGCNFAVLLEYGSNEINASADGDSIMVSKGIVRFAENDDELALVIAHELAHNVMQHVGKMRQNSMVGSLGGLAVDGIFAAAGIGTNGQFMQMGAQMGAGANGVAFEQEADYIGMYFMERAGFNSTGVADFWRRMAAENPRSIYNRTSHPTTPERFIAIERTHDEIARKKARHEKLVPEMKP
jgi:beta-barrel assembly-enhancing protease